MGLLLWFKLLLLFLYVFTCTESTISPASKIKKHVNKELRVLLGPQDGSVFERNLVEVEPAARDILVHNGAFHKHTGHRRFNGTVLGYVTAWNSHGYDVAKIFAKKFDVISPVWFQIVKRAGEYELAGGHDIDNGWLQDVRRKGKRENGEGSVTIMPRVIFDKFTERDVSRMLSFVEERNKVSKLLTTTCKMVGFEGIVLEVWSQLAGRVDDQILYTLIIEMALSFRRHNLRLILVVPPFRQDMPNLFGEKHMDKLYQHVEAFSLMTYDYSTLQRPGANAPLYWVRNSIENIAPNNCHNMDVKRAKILMGLNMYGSDYTPEGGGPIIGEQYLDLLRHVKKRLAYDERDVENYFEIRTSTTGRHYVFYPSLYSINERIKLAQEMGVGISIWELGQGLDYFYDLF